MPGATATNTKPKILLSIGPVKFNCCSQVCRELCTSDFWFSFVTISPPFPDEAGKDGKYDPFEYTSNGIAMDMYMYNTDETIASFVRSSFQMVLLKR